MELHEELGAVRRETVLPADRDAAWQEIRSLEWLETEAEVVEEDPPRRLVLDWTDPRLDTTVEITLDDVPEGTRVVVVEIPRATLRAVSRQMVVAASAPRGPMACV